MIARCSPPWPARSPWPSPSRFSLRAKIRPVTGFFQIPVRTVLPCHATSWGSPTLTETTTPVMEPPVAHLSSVQLARGIKPGTPVPTTVLNRTFVLMPSRISRMASSGSARYLKVLLNMVRFGRGGQESGAALYGPGQRNLSRRLVDALRDGCDHRVIQQFRIQAVSQRCKRQQYNPVLSTEIEQVPFREVRMGFDLHHGRLDPRSRNDLSHFLQTLHLISRSTCSDLRQRGARAPATSRLTSPRNHR